MRARPILIAALVLGLAWLAVPPGRPDLDAACHPASFPARVSAMATGPWFWHRQHAALSAERDHWLTLQSKMMFGENSVSANESRLSQLVEPGHEDAARRFRQNRIAWLSGCLSEMERR